jgi:hypothetical protein
MGVFTTDTTTTNNRFLTGDSFNSFNRNFMGNALRNFVLLFAAVFLFANVGSAQVTVSGGSAAGTYGTLAAAITAVNGASVTAPVTISVTSGNPQTATAGGYVVTVQGTATNTITIQGNSNTVTAGLQSVGNISDAIFKLEGAKYVTITGFTM